LFTVVDARRRPGFRLGAPVRIERRLQFLERRDVQSVILIRHARSAVPSSAGLATGPYMSRFIGQPILLVSQWFRTKPHAAATGPKPHAIFSLIR
jgi:hypothetical protein